MRMVYRQRLAAETVGGSRDVMTAQHILLNLPDYTPFDVVIESGVELRVSAEHFGHHSGQEAAAIS